MARFFPRDVVLWSEERLHPLRAFAVRAIEPAFVTGLVLRLYRALILGATMSAGWVAFVVGLTGGVLILCGMLTWHLGNFPIRRWPIRVVAFVVVELIAEMGVSFEIAERILGHAMTKIERTYNKHEPLAEMASALAAWAVRLEAIVSGKPAAVADVLAFTR